MNCLNKNFHNFNKVILEPYSVFITSVMICDGKLKAYINSFFFTAKTKGLNLPEKVTDSLCMAFVPRQWQILMERGLIIYADGGPMMILIFPLNLCFGSPPTR